MSADDKLTELASIAGSSNRHQFLMREVPLVTLRQMADLCGVGDAEDMTKGQVVRAIEENF